MRCSTLSDIFSLYSITHIDLIDYMQIIWIANAKEENLLEPLKRTSRHLTASHLIGLFFLNPYTSGERRSRILSCSWLECHLFCFLLCCQNIHRAACINDPIFLTMHYCMCCMEAAQDMCYTRAHLCGMNPIVVKRRLFSCRGPGMCQNTDLHTGSVV